MNKPRSMAILLVCVAVAALLAAACADAETAEAAAASAASASDAASAAMRVADAAASDTSEALAGLGVAAADASAAAAAAAAATAAATQAAAQAYQSATELAQANAEGNEAAAAAAEAALAEARAAADAVAADVAAVRAEAEAARQLAAAATAEAAEARTEAAAAQAEAAVATATAEELRVQLLELLLAALDMNDDGDVVFGVATPGPRDDGAYYQALVETVEAFAAASGFSTPIVVDNIQPADAATELANLAEQGVDVLAVGASEIAEPLTDLTEQYSEIFWYCNCGAGYPVIPGLAQAQDDSSQISYSAGYATGMLLRDSGGDSVHFIGCCDLDFEQEAYNAFEMGLQAVDAGFTMIYVPTGSVPFDFDNVSGATEAFNNAVAQGADAVYPYLGGAHEPLVALANENDLIVMSAGASDVCDRTDLDYDLAVQFDAGDYVLHLLQRIADGQFSEGEVFTFTFDLPIVGAKLCDPTAEQQAEFDEERARIAAGAYATEFFGIKAAAYGF